MQTDLIDRIYECSVIPEQWPDLLEQLAHETDAHGGMLFSARKQLNWTASERVYDAFDTYVKDGWFEKCPRRICMVEKSQPTFFVEQDFWSKEELAQNPFYRDFFLPRGLGWSAGTLLQMPTGDNIVFSIEREYESGPIERGHVDRLNELRPHLLRSAFISARLGLQRAQGANETLDNLGIPAVILDSNGGFVEANERAGALNDVLQIRTKGQRVGFGDSRANECLQRALAKMPDLSSADDLSFPVRDADGIANMVGHVMPVRLAAHDIFANSFALLYLTPLDGMRAPSKQLMRSLFDLTAAETRVAGELFKGRTLQEIASDGGVSITTVRTQMRAILEKTGCGRQAELVALLSNVALGSH